MALGPAAASWGRPDRLWRVASMPQEDSQLHSVLDKATRFQRLPELHDSTRLVRRRVAMTIAGATKQSEQAVSYEMWQRLYDLAGRVRELAVGMDDRDRCFRH